MRNGLLIFILCSIAQWVNAQEKSLIIEGSTPNLYLVHNILPKENYYSVGRMYNVPPKELAAYNNLQFEKGLSLGQSIKIPLTPLNFSQGTSGSKSEAFIPLYHIVQPKEGLYRISITYNKVPIELLKKWNNLPNEVVSNGTRLIVGYLKVLKEQSPLAQKGVSVPTVEPPIPVAEKILVAKNEKPVEKEPVINKPEIQKEQNADPLPTPSSKPTIDFNGGYFKKLYPQGENKPVVKENGIAGIFKTTSGWMDGKYYCFHNEAAPGSILKITNISNGKSIYAKVLDAVPDIRQNNGLLLRVSNSAAEELGVTETKFDCSVSYSK